MEIKAARVAFIDPPDLFSKSPFAPLDGIKLFAQQFHYDYESKRDDDGRVQSTRRIVYRSSAGRLHLPRLLEAELAPEVAG